MNLMDMLVGNKDNPNQRSLLGFIGDLPGLLTPGSQGPVPVQGQSELAPEDLANANAMYKRQFRGAQARAVAGGMDQAGTSAAASADAQDSYQSTVKNAMVMADAIKSRRDETARRAQMQELISGGGYTPKQTQVLSALSPDEQEKVVSSNAFAKDQDFFTMTAIGQGKALTMDRRDGTTKVVSLPGDASKFPVGTKVNFDHANNRVIYASPDGTMKVMNLPEPKVPGGKEGLDMQAEAIINTGKPIGRVPQGQLLTTLAYAQKYAQEHYGMDPADVVLHGMDTKAISGALSMAHKQTAGMTTALGSMENNLATAIKYADGVNGANLPVNKILNWSATEIKADKTGKRNQLQLAIRTVVGDWARIIAGSAASTGGSTDTSQADAAKDFGEGKYSGLTLRQLQEVVRADAKGKIAAANATKSGLLKSMRAASFKNSNEDTQDETVAEDGFGDVGAPQ